MGKPRWNQLSRRHRATLLALASVQLSLAATAWADLAKRQPRRVNGPKWAWALVIGVNFVGPIAYFVRGRRR